MPPELAGWPRALARMRSQRAVQQALLLGSLLLISWCSVTQGQPSVSALIASNALPAVGVDNLAHAAALDLPPAAVSAIATSGTDTYIGGSFSHAGGVLANNIVRMSSGSFFALQPSMSQVGTDGVVSALAIVPSPGVGPLWLGGTFKRCGGMPAPLLARWSGSAFSAFRTDATFAPADAAVFSLAANAQSLFVGGTFQSVTVSFTTIPVNGVFRLDLTTPTATPIPLQALGSSLPGVVGVASGPRLPGVYALAISGSRVFLGGFFTSAGPIAAANNVAIFNGSAFLPLGDSATKAVGTSGVVLALSVSLSGSVALGGVFTTCGGRTSSNVCTWSGTAFSTLAVGAAVGVNGPVQAIAFDGAESSPIVAGAFSFAGGIASNGIAKFTGTTFTPFGPGGSPLLAVEAINVLTAVPGGGVLAGGAFGTFGGVVANGILRCSVTMCSPVNGNSIPGLSVPPQALAALGSRLLIGGSPSLAGGRPVGPLSSFDGTSFSTIGSMTGSVSALAAASSTDVIAGGPGLSFFRNGSQATLPQALTTAAVSGNVNAIAVLGGLWAIGGSFLVVGQVTSNLFLFDGFVFTPLTVSGAVNSLAFTPGGDLFIGGIMPSAINSSGAVVTVNSVCRYVSGQFQALPTTVNGNVGVAPSSGLNAGVVNDLALNGADLYVAGVFASAGGVSGTQNIARYDGTKFNPLRVSIPGPISALLLVGAELWIGGAFAFSSTTGTVPFNNIARWSTSSSLPVAVTSNGQVGVDGPVSALALWGNSVVAAGSFATGGNRLLNGVAVWSLAGLGPSALPSASPTASISATPSRSFSSSASPSPSVSRSSSVTASATISSSRTPSTSVSQSVTPSSSISRSVTASGSASQSVTASVTASRSVTPSTSVSPSVSRSITPSPSVTRSRSRTPSITPSKSRTASVSPSPSISPTMSITPSAPVRLEVSFSAGVHRASFASPSPAALGTASPTRSVSQVPVTVVSRAWVPPILSWFVTSGCVGTTNALVFRCTSSVAETAGGARLTSQGPPIAFQPPFVQLPPADGVGCRNQLLSRGTTSFQLFDARDWTQPANKEQPGCFLDANGPDRLGYRQPPVVAARVRCDLLELSGPEPITIDQAALDSASVVSSATAMVLLVSTPLFLPSDLMVMRPPPPSSPAGVMASVQSMRTGVSLPVLWLANSTAASAGTISTALAILQKHGNDTLVTTIQHYSLASAAQSLFGIPPAADTAPPALALSGSTTLVVKLDQRSSPFFPPPEALRTQYDAEQTKATYALSEAGSIIPFSLGAARQPVFSLMKPRAACEAPALPGLAQTVIPGAWPSLVPSIYVGNRKLRLLWIAPDGSQLHYATPSYAELCADSKGADCGLHGLTFRYEKLVGAGRRLALPEWEWLATWLREGGSAASNATALSSLLARLAPLSVQSVSPTVQCPPWCPSSFSTEVLPMALPISFDKEIVTPGFERWQGVLVPGLSDGATVPGSSSLVPKDVLPNALAAESATTAGLRYVAQCQGFTDFTIPGVCDNATHPLSRNCAFGSGDHCSPCPTYESEQAAVCPGGSRAWPLRGFYTPSEDSGFVERCVAPAEERCLGWSQEQGRQLCGEAYSGTGCSACAMNFYRTLEGSCKACPPPTPISTIARLALLFGGALIACIITILAVTALIALVARSKMVVGWTRLLDLAVWSIIVLQLLAQVGRSTVPGVPEAVQTLLKGLAALQFEDVAIPPACWSLYPFVAEVFQMGAVLFFSVVLWIKLLRHIRCCKRVCPRCRRKPNSTTPAPAPAFAKKGLAKICTPRFWGRLIPLASFSLLTLLYSLLANTVLKLLSCQKQQVSRLALLSLDRDVQPSDALALQGGTTSSASAGALIEVNVMAANPSFVCYQGSHKFAAYLAWITAVFFLAFYPLWSYVWAQRRIIRVLKRRYQGLEPHFGSSVKVIGPGSGVVGNGKDFKALQAADAAAVGTFLRRHPFCGRVRFCVFGVERTMAAFGQQEDKNVPKAPERRSPSTSSFTLRSLMAQTAAGQSMGLVDVLKNRSGAMFTRSKRTAAWKWRVIATGNLVSAAADHSASVATNGALSHFTGTAYRASAFQQRQVDMLAFAALAGVQTYFPRPQTVAEAAKRGVAYVGVLLVLAWFVATRRPFPRAIDAPGSGGNWKVSVKVGSLAVSALCVALTHFSLVLDLRYGEAQQSSPRDLAIRNGLSIALLFSCAVLFLLLLMGFVLSAVTGVKEDIKRAAARIAEKGKMAAEKARSAVESVSPKSITKTTPTVHEGLNNDDLRASSSSDPGSESSEDDDEDPQKLEIGGSLPLFSMKRRFPIGPQAAVAAAPPRNGRASRHSVISFAQNPLRAPSTSASAAALASPRAALSDETISSKVAPGKPQHTRQARVSRMSFAASPIRADEAGGASSPSPAFASPSSLTSASAWLVPQSSPRTPAFAPSPPPPQAAVQAANSLNGIRTISFSTGAVAGADRQPTAKKNHLLLTSSNRR